MRGARESASRSEAHVSELQIFEVAELRTFQVEAAQAMARARSRTFLNVSTGGGKTLALLFNVVRDAVLARATKGRFSIALCFTPLLALQADHVQKLRRNAQLDAFLEVLTLADVGAERRLRVLLHQREPLKKAVLVFLNPERFAVHKLRLLDAADRVSYILFDEVHTYVSWLDFRHAFDSLRGIARDFARSSLACATATLTASDLDAFSSAVGVQTEEWSVVRHLSRRENHFYHVVEERMLLGHVGELFDRSRLPALVIVNSITMLHALHARIADWAKLPLASVLLYAAGFSEEHKRDADRIFRDPLAHEVVMIATTAYALGIDAFITSVVLYGVPESVTAFVQGAGRAGRDASIAVAHCTLVVDVVGLRGTDDAMKRVLGMMRVKPKKPQGSHQAQCSLCLKWSVLPQNMTVPGPDDSFFCEQAGALCSNVSRFPLCVHVIVERFLKGDHGLIDRPLQGGEVPCGTRCDSCQRPPIRPPPSVGHFVRVVSAGSVNFQRVGKVVGHSNDLVRAIVNFGGADSEVSMPHDILAVLQNKVVELPPQLNITLTSKPRVLRASLIDFFGSFETVLPSGLLFSDSAITALAAIRPETAQEVMVVCPNVHPDCAEGVAQLIAKHNRDSGSKRSKKKKTVGLVLVQEPSDDDSDDEDAACPSTVTMSSRGRTVKRSKKWT